MAEITFRSRDVVRLLDLPNPATVDGLVADGTLRVLAYTDGHPLFTAADVRRAAAELALAERVARRRRDNKEAAR